MKDMKSRTNVDNNLSLILRFAILLHSLVKSSESSERSLSSLGSSDVSKPLPTQLSAQFVSEALPQTQSLSLSSLALSSIAPPERKASNESNGCSPLVSDPICSCYALDEGLLIDCKITAIYQMTDVLNSLISQPIKSFSVYSINHSLNSLPENLFQNFSSIEQLYISVPSLVEVGSEAFVGLETSLKTLSLVNSKLKAVPKPALNNLKSLSALDLQSNAIREVESYAFYGLPLVSLNLQSNLIHSLHEFSFGGLENTLVELVLIDNRLERFPLHAFQRFRRLEILKLQSNRISEIPDDGFTRFTVLKSLDLQSNRFDHLDGRSFITTPNLVSLSVANNRLTVVNDSSIFEGLLALETLDLSYNYLRVVDLNNLSALRTVDLSNNHLHDIRFHNLPNLKEVFVSNNNILRLTNETFINSSSVSVIFLQHNAIQSIDYNTFHSLQHLLTLDLSSNQLQAIDPQLLKYNTRLQALYLDGNPFHCDCRLLSMYEWLESHSRQLALNDSEDMICAQPEMLKHSSILSLRPVDFCPVPLISLKEISKLESTQVRIKWEVQNDSLVDGFTLEHYLTANKTLPLTQKLLGPFDRQSDITDLKPENWYTVCVEANGKYLRSESNKPTPYVIDQNKNFSQYVTTNRKCSQVRTLSHSERTLSLSTLGTIFGVVVFVVLMLTLYVLWVVYKFRSKRRPPLKSEAPEDYITYRHFSLPSSENVYS